MQYETAKNYTIKKQVSRYFSSFFLLNNEVAGALVASSKVKLRYFFTLNMGIFNKT